MTQQYTWPSAPRAAGIAPPSSSITPVARPGVPPAPTPVQATLTLPPLLPPATAAVPETFLRQTPVAAEPVAAPEQQAALAPAPESVVSPVEAPAHVEVKDVAVATVAVPEVAEIPPAAKPLPSSTVEWAQPLPAASAKPKRTAIMSKMPSLGLLDQLIADDEVHDILVNGTGPIYIDRGLELEDSGLKFATNDEVWRIAEIIMAAVGQRWDPLKPMIDTRLADGSRVNIVAPPMAIDGVSISIRKFPKLRVTLDDMVAREQVSAEVVEFLKLIVAARLNIVISGGTGSGKTTLMNALSSAISPKERIVTIEDAAELRLQQPHVVRLESTSSSLVLAQDSAVTIRDLVRNALRMRPDRILVGEARGVEAFDILQAMNTGHDGSMTTLHANTARDALSRLESMVTMAMPQMPIRVVRGQVANTLHLIIQTNRTKDGQRRIAQITEIAGMEGETIVMQDLILLREDEKTGQTEYRWVAGSSRNPHITLAAQQAGLMRGFR